MIHLALPLGLAGLLVAIAVYGAVVRRGLVQALVVTPLFLGAAGLIALTSGATRAQAHTSGAALTVVLIVLGLLQAGVLAGAALAIHRARTLEQVGEVPE